MKLAFVVPRYGEEVLGGAELVARSLAERIAALPGWEVDALSTCALDYQTWDNHYRPGYSHIAGVGVHRFLVRAGRDPGFSAYSEHVLFYSRSSTDAEADRWIDLQGPVCPELVDAVASCEADLIAFYPYQYYPTVRAITSVTRRAIMHPAAHDDPPLYLPVFRPVFAAARAFVFQTMGERNLVQSQFPVASRRHILLGPGVDEAPPTSPGLPGFPGLEGRPYLCCVGRVDDLKGTSLLVELFAAYKRRRPSPLALVLAGPVSVRPIAHPDVLLSGPVDEASKWSLLGRATALVQPSPWESFSVVLMEAWSAGIPVIVNGYCEATSEHCTRSGGGVTFSSYAGFEVALDRLLGDPTLRDQLAARGKSYVDANFRWPLVIDRYSAFLTDVASHLQ